MDNIDKTQIKKWGKYNNCNPQNFACKNRSYKNKNGNNRRGTPFWGQPERETKNIQPKMPSFTCFCDPYPPNAPNGIK